MYLSSHTLVTRRKQIQPVIQKQIILRTGFSSVLIDYPLLTVSFCFCLSEVRFVTAVTAVTAAGSLIFFASGVNFSKNTLVLYFWQCKFFDKSHVCCLYIPKRLNIAFSIAICL